MCLLRQRETNGGGGKVEFGFVTIDGIIDVGTMEKLLNTIWIGMFKLRVNARQVDRFVKGMVHKITSANRKGERGVKRHGKRNGRIYVDVVRRDKKRLI